MQEQKTAIVEMVLYADGWGATMNAYYSSKKLGLGYTYVIIFFSEATGAAIEHFITAHKF